MSPSVNTQAIRIQELEATFRLWKAEHTAGAEGAGGSGRREEGERRLGERGWGSERGSASGRGLGPWLRGRCRSGPPGGEAGAWVSTGEPGPGEAQAPLRPTWGRGQGAIPEPGLPLPSPPCPQSAHLCTARGSRAFHGPETNLFSQTNPGSQEAPLWGGWSRQGSRELTWRRGCLGPANPHRLLGPDRVSCPLGPSIPRTWSARGPLRASARRSQDWWGGGAVLAQRRGDRAIPQGRPPGPRAVIWD